MSLPRPLRGLGRWLGTFFDLHSQVRAEVCWITSNLHVALDNIKLLHLLIQTLALLTKMMVRGLLLGYAPWETLLRSRVLSFQQRRAGTRPPLMLFSLRPISSCLGVWTIGKQRCGFGEHRAKAFAWLSQQPRSYALPTMIFKPTFRLCRGHHLGLG